MPGWFHEICTCLLFAEDSSMPINFVTKHFHVLAFMNKVIVTFGFVFDNFNTMQLYISGK
jgi:hypothetical protein